MRLLLITDGIPNDLNARLDIACALLSGFPFFVQLRAKQASGRALFEAAQNIVKHLDGRAPLVVNDRLDIARAAGAAGVHLPSTGLPIAAARAAWPQALIGRSTHSIAEVEAARNAGADYVVYGPISAVPGKQSLGWSLLAAAVQRAAPLPLYALGGLSAADLGPLAAQGAHLALIRGGLGATTMSETFANLEALGAGLRQSPQG